LRQPVTLPAMKLTIDIDDELMARVKDVTCAKTNEEAILTAADSMAQLIQLKAYFSRGPHPTGKQVREAWDPNYKLDRELLAQHG